jgi:hypothetical protein
MDTISGKINNTTYNIDRNVVEKLKIVHNIDAIKEIEDALLIADVKERDIDENQSNAGKSSSN